jgi:hypothetical protein
MAVPIVLAVLIIKETVVAVDIATTIKNGEVLK